MLARSKYGSSRCATQRGGRARGGGPAVAAQPARACADLAVGRRGCAAPAPGRARWRLADLEQVDVRRQRGDRRPSVRRGHHAGQPRRGRAWPSTSLRQVVLRARSPPAPRATSCADSTAVLAPRSCASLTVCRMPSRRAPSSRCSAGVSTYTACQVTASCPASCAALRTTCSAPSCGPMQHSSAPSVFHTCAIERSLR